MMNLMGVLSNITINVLMSSYGSAAVAAVGVAKKVDNVSFAVATGISQGVLPLIAYNYASGDHRRMSAHHKDDICDLSRCPYGPFCTAVHMCRSNSQSIY